MKFKYLLSLAVASSLSMFACSDNDDSNTVVPEQTVLNPDTVQVNPDPQPVNPLDTTTPAPINPINPIDTITPIVPMDTVPSPIVPIDTITPDVPVDPVQPIVPVDPQTPVSPVDTTPVKPTLDPNKKYKFYGAELTGLQQFHYGRFEAKMKMAALPGTVSSMFLYYDPSYLQGTEPWNEIDIEILGKSDTTWQSNIITRTPDTEVDGNVVKGKKSTSEKHQLFGFKATEDFHLYAIVWTPEYIAWEIDSVEVRRDTLGMAKGQVEFMTLEQSLRFNLWAANSAGWAGKFTGEGLPIEQDIDYIRTYSYDETTKGFNLLWQDDFDGTDLDSKRWSRGDWEMEKVMYRAENIRVENGFVKIIMDYEEE